MLLGDLYSIGYIISCTRERTKVIHFADYGKYMAACRENTFDKMISLYAGLICHIG